jgi:Asp-tRNA(Asn)/Glu-tRNA(Gln) amidotransferase B subunit
MSGMEDKSQLMTWLLRERAATMSKLNARMELLSHARIALSENQMAGYAAFMSDSRKNAQELSRLLNTVEDSKNLNIVQKEIMRKDTDYNEIMNQIGQMIASQNQAIDNLSQTIYEGETLLESLA